MRAAAAALLVGCAVLGWPGAAAASCAAPPDPLTLSEYDQVFAGVVERVTDGGVAAEVRVVDVWHGPDLPPRVVVVGGALGPGVDSSTDRHYRDGDRFAFFVSRGGDGRLSDSLCSPTGTPASLADLDPPGVRPPDASAEPVTDPRSVLSRAGTYRTSAAVAGTVVATGVVLRRRLSRRRRAPR